MAKKSTRLEELHNTFQENGISPETVMQNDRLIRETVNLQITRITKHVSSFEFEEEYGEI